MASKDDERRAQQALMADPRNQWFFDAVKGLPKEVPMTPPDAVVNAPVTRAHREEAARAFCSNSTADSANVKFSAEWLRARELDDADELPEPFTPVSPLTITGKLDAFAQSLANLEAAVRREYEGVVRCARDVTDARGAPRHYAIQALLIELDRLETLKNG